MIQVESTDVVLLMLQFMREQGLVRSMRALQEESGVALNTVDSKDDFILKITNGLWDEVLRTVVSLNLPARKLFDLYEHIAIELIDAAELHAARTLLRQTDVMQRLRDAFPDRAAHIESLLARAAAGFAFDPRASYPHRASRDKRRALIAQSLAAEVVVVPSGRLLTLLGQCLKYQKSVGMIPDDDDDGGDDENGVAEGAGALSKDFNSTETKANAESLNYDLFRGVVVGTSHDHAKIENDSPASTIYQSIKFPKKVHAESVVFSPDGQYMVTGSLDGMIEVWSYITGKLRRDLKYQVEENFMSMESAVLCLTFSKDSTYLASGSQDGFIKVWKIATGSCVRRFPTAHNQGVTAVSFSKDGTQVLSSSFDQTVRIHGIKSGKLLKEFRGHVSFVNDAIFASDGSRVISGSSDGTLKIWDVKTTECIRTITLHDGRSVTSGVHSATVQRIVPLPNNSDLFVVCNKSGFVYIISLKGSSSTSTGSTPVAKYFRIQKSNAFLTDREDNGSSEASVAGATSAAAAAAAVAASVNVADVVSVCVSAKGEFLYAITEDGFVHWFSMESESVFSQGSMKVK
ncbi:hypothetical protein HDU83_009523 [Entophlyctis luteolus]|nr:hypothetical protein HDU83_009523 [Entophlyctis luteolus]